MRKVILKLSDDLSPGDVVLLTATVRDLYTATYRDGWALDVRTPAPALWENNPYLTPLEDGAPDVETVLVEAPLATKANWIPYHFIHAFRMDAAAKLGVEIPAGAFRGDLYLSDTEKKAPSPATEAGWTGPYWLIAAGGKYDMTCKWWHPAFYQKVVNRLRGRIKFVQIGAAGDWHLPLEGVVNLVGRTDLRQLVRLVYHAEGVVCPVTFPMHLAAAVPPRDGHHRPCVVVAGGREPAHWEAYPTHRFLHTTGALPCNVQGGCWRMRCQPVGDGHPSDAPEERCVAPVQVAEDLVVPRCMYMIRPHDVVRAIRTYYRGDLVEKRAFVETARSLCVAHVRRSGGHPFMNWVASQAGSPKVLFFNDVNHGDVLDGRDIDRKAVTAPLPSIAGRHRFEDVVGREHDLVLYSYESAPPADAAAVGNVVAGAHQTVLLLRDPFNTLASQAAMGRWPTGETPPELAGWMALWKAHAREFIRIRDAGGQGEVAVSYNAWLTDGTYRDTVAEALGLPDRTDAALPQVPAQGGGSSFDGQGAGAEHMTDDRHFKRWEVYRDVPWFKAVFKDDPELVALSEQIFGHIDGTEALTA